MRGTSGQDHPQLSCTASGWTFLSKWRTTSGFRRQAAKPSLRPDRNSSAPVSTRTSACETDQKQLDPVTSHSLDRWGSRKTCKSLFLEVRLPKALDPGSRISFLTFSNKVLSSEPSNVYFNS